MSSLYGGSLKIEYSHGGFFGTFARYMCAGRGGRMLVPDAIVKKLTLAEVAALARTAPTLRVSDEGYEAIKRLIARWEARNNKK